MILYDPSISLEEYRVALIDLRKYLRLLKFLHIIARVILILILLSWLIVAISIVTALKNTPSWLLYIPYALAVISFFIIFSLSIKERENAIANFLMMDYKREQKDVCHDIKTVEYYIKSLENGKTPDPVYAYISSS